MYPQAPYPVVGRNRPEIKAFTFMGACTPPDQKGFYSSKDPKHGWNNRLLKGPSWVAFDLDFYARPQVITDTGIIDIIILILLY